MNKKYIAIIIEIIPILSSIISLTLIKSIYDSSIVRSIIIATMTISFLGFVFFFIGRILAKNDKTVRILGILDWLSTIYVVALYTIVFLVFGF